MVLGEIRPEAQNWHPGPVRIASLCLYMCTYSRIQTASRTSGAVQVEGAAYAPLGRNSQSATVGGGKQAKLNSDTQMCLLSC